MTPKPARRARPSELLLGTIRSQTLFTLPLTLRLWPGQIPKPNAMSVLGAPKTQEVLESSPSLMPQGFPVSFLSTLPPPYTPVATPSQERRPDFNPVPVI
jgi:hypothetical protein